MASELVFTSAEKGLKPRSSGFCTVAMTFGLSTNIVERLEGLSGYRAAFPAHDPRAAQNPVNFSYYRFQLGGKTYPVLSRVAFHGVDYTGRSNKFAHHLLLDSEECVPAGPAAMALAPETFRTEWTGEPKALTAPRGLARATPASGVAQTWREITGDAGWAGVVAAFTLANPDGVVAFLFKPEMPSSKLLALINEAMRLLPPAERWRTTFSTYLTDMPTGTTCRWRCMLHGSAEFERLRRKKDLLTIDLAAPLGAVRESGELIEAARTGAEIKAEVPESVTAAGRVAPRPAQQGSPPPQQPAAGAYDLKGNGFPDMGVGFAGIAPRDVKPQAKGRNKWVVAAAVIGVVAAAGAATTWILIQRNSHKAPMESETVAATQEHLYTQKELDDFATLVKISTKPKTGDKIAVELPPAIPDDLKILCECSAAGIAINANGDRKHTIDLTDAMEGEYKLKIAVRGAGGQSKWQEHTMAVQPDIHLEVGVEPDTPKGTVPELPSGKVVEFSAKNSQTRGVARPLFKWGLKDASGKTTPLTGGDTLSWTVPDVKKKETYQVCLTLDGRTDPMAQIKITAIPPAVVATTTRPQVANNTATTTAVAVSTQKFLEELNVPTPPSLWQSATEYGPLWMHAGECAYLRMYKKGDLSRATATIEFPEKVNRLFTPREPVQSDTQGLWKFNLQFVVPDDVVATVRPAMSFTFALVEKKPKVLFAPVERNDDYLTALNTAAIKHARVVFEHDGEVLAELTFAGPESVDGDIRSIEKEQAAKGQSVLNLKESEKKAQAVLKDAQQKLAEAENAIGELKKKNADRVIEAEKILAMPDNGERSKKLEGFRKKKESKPILDALQKRDDLKKKKDAEAAAVKNASENVRKEQQAWEALSQKISNLKQIAQRVRDRISVSEKSLKLSKS